MPLTTNASVDDALSALRSLAAGANGARRAATGTRRKRRSLRSAIWHFTIRIGLGATAVMAVVALPFLLLVFGSVHWYLSDGLPGWLSLMLGGACVWLLLLVYFFVLSRMLGGNGVPSKWIVRGTMVLVAIYCGYALLYVSGAHVKSAAERATYTALHPLLRLSVSTLTLADGDLVITDGERVPEDYTTMGLPVLDSSMHYVQPDGYAHAVDLRTNGRAAWKNVLMQGFFDAMGFRTLRHVGTADHLHVSLPMREGDGRL